MVNIYTSYNGEKFVINDNNAYFISQVPASSLDNTDYKIIKLIDGGEPVDKTLGTIKTTFGVTTLDNLSTGCKTVLNYRYIKKNNLNYIIDATESGWNALEELFNQVEQHTDDKIILRHCDDLFKCSDRSYKINGKTVVDTSIGLSMLL